VNMDAFGDDVEDLSVMTFVLSTFKTSNRILDVEFLEKESDVTEEAIRRSSIYGEGLQNYEKYEVEVLKGDRVAITDSVLTNT
jgi:hypothetical protein